ncbi:MAG: DNA polymerase I [Clostridia bacterium]|nr:DNA polymerase I [Clostridia bacterium]
MKLLAIDGNSILNRAFYGIKLLSTKNGVYTNAVYGFINILNKLLEDETPDGVAVAFDLKKPTFRHLKYDAYKAGRHKTPDELLSQFPIIKEWLLLAGYHVIECEGFEADDILGTLAKSSRLSGHECVIATGDRDSLQLVSESTRVLLASTRMGKTEVINYTPEKVKERYGVTPKEMIELKALMGDSSDNIPGVAGVGEKTATDLISRFHSVEYIYANIDTIDIKDTVKAKLIADKAGAELSKFLGTICCDAPINTDIPSYKNGSIDSEKLAALMTELEFFKLMQKMSLSPVSSAKPETASTAAKTFTVVTDFEELDIKSADLYEKDGRYFIVSDNKIFETEQENFSFVLCNGDIEKRVYSAKEIYKNFSGAENITFDALLAGYLCNPASNDYSLSRLAVEYGAVPQDINGDTALSEAALFSLTCDALYNILSKTEELKLLRDIEIPLSKVLTDMESEGFKVDVRGLTELGEEFNGRIEVLKQEIYSLAGCEFNINSPKQLGEVLFEKLGLPAKKKTKSGYSTNADVLETLRYDYPIVESVLKYRTLAKLKSTYCDGLLNAVTEDGRIHTTFNQTEARTGRISSLEPNLQNIPVRTDEGKRLREFFVAKDGYTLCDADYSQIELRVLASVADDKNMIAAFESGTDIHTVTASEVFDIPIDMVLPIMRSRAKAVNFGIVYGIGAFSLGKDIGVSRAEADRYIKNYLSTYKGVADYMERVIADAKRDGFVTTAFGRRRYLPELSSSNGMLRAFGERVARNAPIQGTAADIIKIAMIRVSQRLKKELSDAKLILQVHDELIVECPEDKADIAVRILTEEMENAAKLKDKLSADAHCGKNWLIAKG